MSGQPVDQMFASLAGLSVGDGFGERFFFPANVAKHLAERSLPPAPWSWTDDTNMALSIVDVLLTNGTVDQNALASSFGNHFDPTRGYGPAMHRLLPRCAMGADWRQEAVSEYHGEEYGLYSQRIVHTERYKLVYNCWDRSELYDLATDPFELCNLYDEPGLAAVRRDLETRLLAWMEQTDDQYYRWTRRMLG